MSRVSLGRIDPMPALRAAAVDQVNGRFDDMSRTGLHRDQAHAYKRIAAAAVLAGAAPADEFKAEADLRGLTPVALARIIASKPSNLAQRELARQKMLAAIDRATTPGDLDQIVKTGLQG